MIDDAAGRDVLRGGGAVAVDVAALERELSRLWQAAGADGAETPGGVALEARPAAVRACTRNLILLVTGTDQAARAGELVAAVASRHPARAFVVNQTADLPAGAVEAYLTAHCTLLGEGRRVGCEQVNLDLGPEAGRRAAGAIVPLLVPDLSVFVCFTGEPAWDDDLAARLLAVADRVVVDVRQFGDAVAGLERLVARRARARWAPGDFEWSRLAPWREAVASLFDDPAAADLAPAIREIQLGFAGAPRDGAGAAHLAAWVEDRLAAARDGAPPSSSARPGAMPAAGSRAGAAIRVRLVAGEEGRPGDVTSVVLAAPGSSARLEARRPAGHETALVTRLELAHACGLPSRLPGPAEDPAGLLGDQLEFRGRRSSYERALPRAAALLARAAD